MKSITVECPDDLHKQLDELVRSGWIKAPQEAILEGLRRYLECHTGELQESQLLSDVDWGLRGSRML